LARYAVASGVSASDTVRGMERCIACDLASGRVPLPGGRIHETHHWLVEHCVGPLGVGTLIVKPKRHVLRVSALTADETRELGALLTATAAAVDAIVKPDQVYVTLWSHAGGEPGHIHWVIQPVADALMADYDGLYGPRPQVAMFERNEPLPADAVAAIADRMRAWFATNAGAVA
jgi:diadenosine tetraphosphate (Ap4A) HIT family hydrolase